MEKSFLCDGALAQKNSNDLFLTKEISWVTIIYNIIYRSDLERRKMPMKEEYITPEMEITELENVDVIATSDDGFGTVVSM